tara:strand:- start:1825 stop:1953 length:129 start_codon:yes stop_codon:yes gene_type:complete
MPVWLRRFYIKKIEDFKKQEADAHKKANEGKSGQIHRMGGGR